MSIRDMIDLMERHLPCPPEPLPELGSDADYLWKATQFNAGLDWPRSIVELREWDPVPYDARPADVIPDDLTVRIIRVECDARGKGIRVVR